MNEICWFKLFLIYTFYRNVSEFLTEEQTSESFPFEDKEYL